MNHEINLHWNGKMSFDTLIDGHQLTVDAADEFGGQNKGPRPKQLLLLSLAGCSAMDVVSLAEKMHANLEGLDIKVQGVMNDEHPKKYYSITLVYQCLGKEIEKDKIEKAVKMSEEKYCGVWATLKPGVKIDYRIEYL